MSSQLFSEISKNLLFRYTIPLRRMELAWSGQWLVLDEGCRLPHFGQFEGQPTYADVRGCWNQAGLFFTVVVGSKRQAAQCHVSKLLESDGVQFWVDTRDVHNVHRASRFCHWFAFLPTQGNTKAAKPLGTMLKINRAKEDPKTFQGFQPRVMSELKKDGYRLAVLLPASSLSGWNPAEHRKLGFQYAVIDRELGWQTLAADFRFPIAEDPSLWQTLELVE